MPKVPKPSGKKGKKKGYKSADEGMPGDQTDLGIAEPISPEKVRELSHKHDECCEKVENYRRQLKDANAARRKAEELLLSAARQVKETK